LPPSGSRCAIRTSDHPQGMYPDPGVCAAGSQTESVKLRTEDLFRDEPVTIAPLTRSSATGEEASDEGSA
jgi:hypothetical protein